MPQNVLCFHVPNISQILSYVHPSSQANGSSSKSQFARGALLTSTARSLLRSRFNYGRSMSAVCTTATALKESYTEGCKNLMRAIQPVQDLVQRFCATNFVLSWHNSYTDIRMALDKLTLTKYALKVVPKDSSSKAQELYQEAECWQAVQDSNGAADLEGVYEDPNNMYFLYELCRGGDLQYLLETHGMMTEAEAAQIVHSLLTLICECHEKNILFGPTHPERLGLAKMYPSWAFQQGMTDNPGPISIKATDFSACRRMPPGQLMKQPTGKAIYMSPEMLTHSYGPESDMWGVGVLMYQLLSGELPFCSALMHSHTQGQPPPDAILAAISRSQLNFSAPAWANVSPEARDLLTRMLQVCPTSRISAKSALQHQWFQKLRAVAASTDRNITQLSPNGFANGDLPAGMVLGEDFLDFPDPLDSLEDVAVCEIMDLGKSGGAASFTPSSMASGDADGLSADGQCKLQHVGDTESWSLVYRSRLAAQLPDLSFFSQRLMSPATVAMLVAMSGVYVLMW